MMSYRISVTGEADVVIWVVNVPTKPVRCFIQGSCMTYSQLQNELSGPPAEGIKVNRMRRVVGLHASRRL